MENFSLVSSHNLLENPLLFPTEITNLLFVIKTRNLNVNPLEFNFSESCSLLVHSMLPNCRFRLDRKKKYCPIPDAASERV